MRRRVEEHIYMPSLQDCESIENSLAQGPCVGDSRQQTQLLDQEDGRYEFIAFSTRHTLIRIGKG